MDFTLDNQKHNIMTKTDLFRVCIKVFGLYGLLMYIQEVLNYILPNIYILFSNEDEFREITSLIFLGGISSLLVIGIYLVTIVNTGLLIKWFRLDKNFDSEIINFENIKARSLLSTGIIIVGLYFTVANFSTLAMYLYYTFRASVSTFYNDIPIKDLEAILSGTNFIIGLMMIINAQFFSKFMKEESSEL
jgi:hypothetical protein